PPLRKRLLARVLHRPARIAAGRCWPCPLVTLVSAGSRWGVDARSASGWPMDRTVGTRSARRPESVDRLLVDLMDPMLGELAVPDVEEIDACPLDRSSIAFDTDGDQRRNVVITRQDVVHLRTEGAVR